MPLLDPTSGAPERLQVTPRGRPVWGWGPRLSIPTPQATLGTAQTSRHFCLSVSSQSRLWQAAGRPRGRVCDRDPGTGLGIESSVGTDEHKRERDPRWWGGGAGSILSAAVTKDPARRRQEGAYSSRDVPESWGLGARG